MEHEMGTGVEERIIGIIMLRSVRGILYHNSTWNLGPSCLESL